MRRAWITAAGAALLLAGCSGGSAQPYDEAMDEAAGDLATNFGETATERLSTYESLATDFCDLFRQGTEDEGMSEDELVEEAIAASELAERDEDVLRDMLGVVIEYRCDTSQPDGLKTD